MEKLSTISITLVVIFSSCTLIPDASDDATGQNITTIIHIFGTGNISCVWSDIPTFVIKSDDGNIYLPTYLSPNLRYIGTQVRFAGQVDYSEFTNDNQIKEISLNGIAEEDFFEPKLLRFNERMSFPVPR